MANRLSDVLGGQISDAIDAHAQSEQISFDVSMVVPGMTEKGPLPPVMVGHLFMDGPILGTVMSAAFEVKNPAKVSGEEIANVVYAVLDQLRSARSAQLAEINANPNGADLVPPGWGTQNGPQTGLVIP